MPYRERGMNRDMCARIEHCTPVECTGVHVLMSPYLIISIILLFFQVTLEEAQVERLVSQD